MEIRSIVQGGIYSLETIRFELRFTDTSGEYQFMIEHLVD